jgi:hypothetical protein
MKKLFVLTFLLMSVAFAQSSTIQDTLLTPTGAPFSGALTVSWADHSNASGTHVDGGSMVVQVDRGSLLVTLEASDRAKPPIVYTVSGSYRGEVLTDTWFVPTSTSNLALSAVSTTKSFVRKNTDGSVVLPSTLSVADLRPVSAAESVPASSKAAITVRHFSVVIVGFSCERSYGQFASTSRGFAFLGYLLSLAGRQVQPDGIHLGPALAAPISARAYPSSRRMASPSARHEIGLRTFRARSVPSPSRTFSGIDFV